MEHGNKYGFGINSLGAGDPNIAFFRLLPLLLSSAPSASLSTSASVRAFQVIAWQVDQMPESSRKLAWGSNIFCYGSELHRLTSSIRACAGTVAGRKEANRKGPPDFLGFGFGIAVFSMLA